MKNKIITGIVLIAVLAGIVFMLNKNKAQNEAETAIVAEKNASVAVRVESVKSEIVNAEYIANGNFIPEQELTLSAETPGRVVKVLVQEGSVVKAGQTLAVINGDQLNVNVQNAQATYATAQADAARFESAYKTGGVTKQQLDQIKLQLENAKANLRSAQITAGDANIKASISGIINKKHIEPGTFVSPGTPLFELVNVSKLKLKVNVDENHVAVLKIGDVIKVKASVFPDKEFEGKITFIAPKADASLNFPVEMVIQNNANNELKAGMYGSAIFNPNADRTTPILTVSRNAFVGSVSSNEIFVVQDSTAQLRKVISGRNFGDKVEILEGLKAGETVIISGQINLIDKTPVNIIK
ncbi:efflux RND transporter periplasmic adaptor subunit [Flavobacterium sp. HSC-61S13]|uniref:efflux RND transporter periplasmic adaptor subunit n=1 Tax=Flavobacterium sp. HSC-61S13 TaxID=2910963 RepID=UPI00209E20BD|nr:efflux RND transporter periplasmic adaptor subunit [Flavobacterium sp. HSC-61S13]MCP1995482.1 RND family efflux transporter MFP subunit [Flavobacterium sp. HSC-61S13]